MIEATHKSYAFIQIVFNMSDVRDMGQRYCTASGTFLTQLLTLFDAGFQKIFIWGGGGLPEPPLELSN